MDLNENSDFQLMFARPDVRRGRHRHLAERQHVVGFRYNDERPHIQFIDPDGRGINQMMDKNVPGTFHEVIDASRDGHLLLIHSYSDVEPGVYPPVRHEQARTHYARPCEQRAVAGSTRPDQPVVVPGPGGISIHGYLTLPVNAAPGKPIAAVVFPHGGPVRARLTGATMIWCS